jgi:hypothetical protein
MSQQRSQTQLNCSDQVGSSLLDSRLVNGITLCEGMPKKTSLGDQDSMSPMLISDSSSRQQSKVDHQGSGQDKDANEVLAIHSLTVIDPSLEVDGVDLIPSWIISPRISGSHLVGSSWIFSKATISSSLDLSDSLFSSNTLLKSETIQYQPLQSESLSSEFWSEFFSSES